MRRTKKRRYSLETIVLSLILLPPLGFFLLWSTARTRKSRMIFTVAFVVFLAVATGAFFKLVYPRLKGPVIPAEGFDITYDSHGRYHAGKVLPFEWTIFIEVVREMRHLQPEHTVPKGDINSIEMVQPEYKAFESVAERHDLSIDDVKGIYIKVTNQLSQADKRKK